MEANRDSLKITLRRRKGQCYRKFIPKKNTVAELIRKIIHDMPEGNKFYHAANRAQNLQLIIRYVTYLETTIDQVSREKNLHIDLNYKILTADHVNQNNCHLILNNREFVNANASRDESSAITSITTNTSGYNSDEF